MNSGSTIEKSSAARARTEAPVRMGVKSSRLADKLDRERARIARELHAGAGQPLVGIRMNLGLLDAWFATQPQPLPEEVKQALLTVHRLTGAALAQVRSISHRLHPPEWQDLSLLTALRLLVNDSGIGRHCEISLRLDPLPLEPAHSVRVALYRCLQECIANVITHSEAAHFSLSLTCKDHQIHLTVHDDGRGIPNDASERGGIGLLSIKEYAEAVDGISRISSDASGTTIRISLPWKED